MKKVINVHFKPHRDLGADSETDERWEALKTKVSDYLKTHADKSAITVDDLRALDSAFRKDRVWEQLRSDLDLIEVELS